MRAMLGMATLLVVLGIGYFIYSAQIREVSYNTPVAQRIDLVAVRAELLAIAQSERLYLTANGSYGTLDQLRRSGNMNYLPQGNRHGYIFAAEVDGAAHFRITATPEGAPSSDLPVLSIDETMKVRQ